MAYFDVDISVDDVISSMDEHDLAELFLRIPKEIGYVPHMADESVDDVISSMDEHDLAELFLRIPKEIGYVPHMADESVDYELSQFRPETVAEEIEYENFIRQMLNRRKGGQ